MATSNRLRPLSCPPRSSAFLSGFLFLVVVGELSAQPLKHPDATLSFVYPAGARQGQTVEVELGGLDGLSNATGVLIEGAPGITVRNVRGSKGGKTAVAQATFVVAADAAPGKRLLRVRGSTGGLSNARPFFVGKLPEVSEKPANDTPETAQTVTLPTVVNGRIEAALDVDCFAFTVQPGQRIVAAVLAHGMDSLHSGGKLGGFLDTSLELLDEMGRVVASAADSVGLDPVLEHVCKTGGRHVIRVQSVLFKGSPSAVYRLTLGDVPYPTHVFPPGGQRGKKVEVAFEGVNVPPGLRHTITVPGEGTPWLSVPFDHPLTDGRELPFIAGNHPEVVQAQPVRERKNAPAFSLPSTVNGRLAQPGDASWQRLTLKKGQSVVLEVTAQRHLRSPLDSLLEVFDAGGQKLADNDDGAPFGQANACAHDFPSSDSHLSFTAPNDGDYFVRLAEQGDASGPQALFRLGVTELRPDFELFQWPDAVPIWGAGTTAAFVVHMHFWGGMQSEIELRIEGLPVGWTGSVANIPYSGYRQFIQPYGYQALMTITAPVGAAVGTAVPFRVIGKAVQQGRTIERVAQPMTLYGGGPSKRRHFRYTPQSWAAVAPSLGCSLTSTVKELTVRLGETVQVPVRVERAAGDKVDLAVTVDGPLNGGAAATAWSSPVSLKPGQTEVLIPLTVSGKRTFGTYSVVVSRSWASDLRGARPGPCTQIIKLNVLPPK